MGLFRRRGQVQAQDVIRQSAGPVQDRLAWLPGSVQVPVAGESFHTEAIHAAYRDSAGGTPLVGVLIPEPDNPHDAGAVAVHVNGHHVGYLPHEVSSRVQPMLVRFAQSRGGRLVSCPAEIRMHDVGPQVLLLLDPGPLGIPAEAFRIAPHLDVVLGRLIDRLDQPVPMLSGVSERARAALAAAESARVRTEADYDRGPRAWQRVEHEFRRAAGQLADGRDPLVSAAWLGVGRSTRYQKGRRDDTLQAFIEALYWNRSNADAWAELVDYASAAPHLPTLIGIYARIPFSIRPRVLPVLLTMSHGHDQLGRMDPVTGARLRTELLTLGESEQDRGTVAQLAGQAGLAAEKAGDLDTAVAWWRRAVAAGSTDEKVADRLSTWLVKQHEFREARAVLRQAMATSPQSPTVAERMQRRLERCERSLTD